MISQNNLPDWSSALLNWDQQPHFAIKIWKNAGRRFYPTLEWLREDKDGWSPVLASLFIYGSTYFTIDWDYAIVNPAYKNKENVLNSDKL